jgi:hypothetical protein
LPGCGLSLCGMFTQVSDLAADRGAPCPRARTAPGLSDKTSRDRNTAETSGQDFPHVKALSPRLPRPPHPHDWPTISGSGSARWGPAGAKRWGAERGGLRRRPTALGPLPPKAGGGRACQAPSAGRDVSAPGCGVVGIFVGEGAGSGAPPWPAARGRPQGAGRRRESTRWDPSPAAGCGSRRPTTTRQVCAPGDATPRRSERQTLA